MKQLTLDKVDDEMLAIIPTYIPVVGTTIRSPCRECFFHQMGFVKKKCAACKICESRIHYDNIIACGWTVYPFLNEKIIDKLKEIKEIQKYGKHCKA